jgi:hypothetical protein
MGQKQVLPLIIISCFDVSLPTSFLSSANFLSMSGMKPSSCDLEVMKRLMPHYRIKKCNIQNPFYSPYMSLFIYRIVQQHYDERKNG